MKKMDPLCFFSETVLILNYFSSPHLIKFPSVFSLPDTWLVTPPQTNKTSEEN